MKEKFIQGSIFALILILLAAWMFVIFDEINAKLVPVGHGIVSKKIYAPATHSTGFGIAPGQKGGGPVIISSSSSEKYILIVLFNGETFSCKVDANTWGSIEEGGSVEVHDVRGTLGVFNRTVRVD